MTAGKKIAVIINREAGTDDRHDREKIFTTSGHPPLMKNISSPL
ncbi:hypothetical protein GbCGDNIH3_5078 [Granulibacter bethesdensis]|uniref:Uncharacterized protein n=1 Tax=Granulibacter bethesdensis TaxID=364410 RepID=A0AAN0VFZ5_9PROT|nr:hypothetical protein GbCGDNIH3_5078 [Granulibacter bethesdensis]